MAPGINSEIKGKYNPEDIVTGLYQVVLGREPDPTGLETHVAAMKAGRSVDDMLRFALASAEFRQRLYGAIRSSAGASRFGFAKPIPDEKFYRPFFSPWNGEGYGEFADYFRLVKGNSTVSAPSSHVLYQVALQALHVRGDFWECGVYKGGTASMLAKIIATKSYDKKRLLLFDTFKGMPEANPKKDIHKQGDFSNTSLNAVQKAVGHEGEEFVRYHEGFIPDTFQGLENSEIALAHVDVDIYQSIVDCCKFIFPRLSKGGFIVFDDYGIASCPGAREAVDEYFRGASIQPLVLPTGQAVVFNGVGSWSGSSSDSMQPEPRVSGAGGRNPLRAEQLRSSRKAKR